MSERQVLNLLRRLAHEPRLHAITPDEVAALLALGYIHPDGVSLTPTGRNRLAIATAS